MYVIASQRHTAKNGIIVELMVVDPAMVEVWATDLNDNGFDNCPVL
ncbi:MAG: hypothetical protein R2788_04645 [Saprospiraceae bacterium]